MTNMEEEILLKADPESPNIKRNSNEKLSSKIRTEFMRDRDRVLYSEPFRRLAGKTQVYAVGNSDHMRNRLTHTLEVSQIARTISSYLSLNCDLTEAIALAHDIGHAPFGHIGERTLHSIMTPHSDHYIKKCPFETKPLSFDDRYGFKHNLHGVKVAYSSELNLTNYTLYGIQAHSKLRYNDDPEDFFELGFYRQYESHLRTQTGNSAWSLEAYVVAIADEIAQRHHDLEDAIIGRIITKKEVNDVICEYFKEESNLDANLEDKTYEKQLSSFIVNKLVEEICKSSREKIVQLQKKYSVSRSNVIEFFGEKIERTELSSIISYSYDFKAMEHGFAKEIQTRVLSSYDIQVADSRGAYVVKKLFQAFYDTPQQLPDNSVISFLLRSQHYPNMCELNRIRQDKGIGFLRKQFGEKYSEAKLEDKILLMRVICDHIAGMTDNYALSVYRKLYGHGNPI